MRKLINILAVIIMLISAVSCGGSINACKPGEGVGKVHVSVTGPGGEIISGEAGLNEGSTVFDVTVYLLKKEGLHFDYSGSGTSVYIKGIDNIYEFDHGAMSGWLYFVNGDDANTNKSCGAYALSDGDRVSWVYTKDGGKDAGV